MDDEKNKYYPYKDLDKNGTVIITPFNIAKNVPGEIMMFNISGYFNGKGLPKTTPERSVTFDFQNLTGKHLRQEDLEFIVGNIEKLYANEISSIRLCNIPKMSYFILAGRGVKGVGAIQWERKEIDKLIAHLHMLYNGGLTKQ
jgi:hypothetical protein